MIVDATAGCIAASVTTNLFQQFCARYEAIRILHKKLQSLELVCRQLERFAVSGHLDLSEVDHNVIKNDLTRQLRGRLL